MSIKNFLLSLGMMIIMSVPTLAGTVEIQTSVPVYTVKEGQTLTEEEQKVIDDTVIYFINNPTVEEVVLSTKDYPSLTYDWYNSLMDKIEVFSSGYAIPLTDGTEFRSTDYFTWVSKYQTMGSYTNYYISNKLLKPYREGEKTLYDLYNWVGYTYDLIPQLGVYNGMNELDAINIFNNWICDYMSYDYSGTHQYNYLNIYEYQKGVCTDYSFLFQTLCEGSGIECSSISNSVHRWNEVIIDGQPLEIDVCWNDDDYTNAYRSTYYLLPRASMSQYPTHENWDLKL